jgi:hypothetical protein
MAQALKAQMEAHFETYKKIQQGSLFIDILGTAVYNIDELTNGVLFTCRPI